MYRNIKTILLVMGLLSFFGCGNKMQKGKSDSSKTQNILSIPYLGDLNLNATKDIEGEVIIDSTVVSIDLNFDENKIASNQIENINLLLENVNSYFLQAKDNIRIDLENNGVVRDYFDHHIEVVSDEKELNKNEDKFLERLKLVRIGLYPEDDQHYALFDFTIGKQITNYIIVVRFNKYLKICSIDFES
jgi:hypothetical protein